MALASQPALSAGTAYGVDTAEVSDPGSCKIESWLSLASNHDLIATANPACVVKLGVSTELSAQAVRSRSDEEWATSISPKAKAKLMPTAIGSFGFALAVGATYDVTARDFTTAFAYVPATLRLSEITRLNINLGWQGDTQANRHFATYGLGFDWRLTETWTWTIETFGLIGQAEPASETRPRFQTGLRYRPVDKFSVDLIYGRNINGENADWVTVANTIRF